MSDAGATFRDPPPLDDEAHALRLAIARVLVRAPRLPVELPAFGLNLVGVTADARSVSLQVGFEHPVAALRLSRARAVAGDAVPLRRPGDGAVAVAVETLHPAAARHERELAAMAERVRRAVTPAQWDEALGHARALRALPVGVPMDFFRQLVPGLREPGGLIRTGFRCNQDCGICWQSRDWGGFDSEQILRWIEDLARAGVRSLILSGGEPTLDPKLEQYLRHARGCGIASLTLETNAIQCARGGLAARLRDAGLTVAFVSLHSADAAVSDAITRAPGTHARTVQGVHALLDAGVTVKLNAVMSAEGLDHLAALPGFIHGEFGRHGNLLRKLMLSYPTDPYDQALIPAIVPEPVKLRRVLRDTLDRCFALGIIPEGLDGPCGPPLCAFGADPRVTSLAPIPEALPFRQYLAACDGCAVRGACFGCRTADVSLYGADCAEPLSAS
ncbi:MAG: radical SAM protein [Deltaproteobacteria bacterium]|nr:radical SAM protein [Deltaproteobacteria bacterium]